MAIVNLTVSNHRVITHPVLQDRVRPEFLDSTTHSPFLINNLERSKAHLAVDLPLVVPAPFKNSFYAVCPVFVAILEKHRWEAFTNMIIPAIRLKLSDDEVEELFWAKVRASFSIIKVCKAVGIKAHNTVDERCVEKTRRQPPPELEDFGSLVSRLNEHIRMEAPNKELEANQPSLWSLDI